MLPEAIRPLLPPSAAEATPPRDVTSRFGRRVRRVFFNAAFYGGLLGWTALFIPLSPFLWGRRVVAARAGRAAAMRHVIMQYGRVCCGLLAALVPFHAEGAAIRLPGVIGSARPPRRNVGLPPLPRLPEPCIIIPNHQSFFDPYCMGVLPITNFVFAVRSWPFRIPLYGRCMRRVGYINTEEMDAETFFAKAGALLREGVSVVIFPEGTRSASGRMGRFHSGAFRLALRENAPIVPMCIDGTGAVFPKGKAFGQPTPVRVRVLDPVDPAAFRSFGEAAHAHLRRHVKHAIQNTLSGSHSIIPHGMTSDAGRQPGAPETAVSGK